MKSQKGFTMFYAVLISSLALTIGVAIFDLTERELELSIAGTQSQYAIYAADTGAECALYWDSKYVNASSNNNGGSSSAFATSSSDTQSTGANAGLDCAGIDITSSAASWSVTQTGSSATTNFSLTLPSTQTSSPCVIIAMNKSGNPPATTVTANGFNTCAPGALQLERTLQLTY